MNELMKNKVYYKIFDKSFKQSSHVYNKKMQLGDPLHIQKVHANRQAIVDYYKAENICILQQVHGSNVIDADNTIIPTNGDDLEADGVVTTKANLVLAVQSADCVPVLLSSKDGMVIGALHCGWRGAKDDIVINVVQLMKAKGGEDIVAAIGPCIHQSSYEVDQKFYHEFIKQQGYYAKFFVKGAREEHFMFDLPSFVEMRLKEAGVQDIRYAGEDTYTNPDKYISYRLAHHMGEPCNTRMLSTIVKE